MFKSLAVVVVLMASTSAFAIPSLSCRNDDGWRATGSFDNIQHGRAYLDALYTPEGYRSREYGLLSDRVENGQVIMSVSTYEAGKIILFCSFGK